MERDGLNRPPEDYREAYRPVGDDRDDAGTGPRRGAASPDHQELIDHIYAFLRQMPDEIPAPLREKVQEMVGREVDRLREMVLERRPPRILMLGRRGCGKSTLVNAIFAQPVAPVGDVRAETGRGRWFRYEGRSGELDILDSRGLGDRTRPDDAEHVDAMAEVRAAVERDDKVPDVILFLCKAKEVDAHVGRDVRLTLELQDHLQATYDYRPPVFGLATQVDELAPPHVSEPPFDDAGKQRNISLACLTLKEAFEEEGVELMKVLPVAAYAHFEDGRIAYDRRWNIDELVDELVQGLPLSAQLIMARASHVKSVQRRLARRLVKSAAVITGGMATVPVPVADTIPITGTQILMVLGIGFLSGREMNRDTAREFLAAMGVNVGAAFVFREVARGLSKLIPVAGSAVNAGIAGGATWALGHAAILYFIEGGTPEEARARLQETKTLKLPWLRDGEEPEPGEAAA